SDRTYSRVGSFGLDSQNNLVDLGTGAYVLDNSSQAVNLDVDGLFPPNATANIGMEGNLPALVGGPLSEVLATVNGFSNGAPASVTNTVAGPNFNGAPNTAYSMNVVVSGGAPQAISVTSDGAGVITAAAVATAISNSTGVTAQVVAGQIEVTTDQGGADLTIKFDPGAGNDLSALVGMPTNLFSGSESVAVAATALNDLTSNVTDYQPGDIIQMTGVDTDGTAINSNFVFGAANDGTTIGDLVTYLDNLYSDAVVSLNGSGQLNVSAQTAGEADLLLSLSDSSSAVGGSDWFDHGLSVATNGTGPDEVVVTSEAYDSAGVAHTLTLTYQRQPNLSWDVIVSMPPDQGQVLTGGPNSPISGITFDGNGMPSNLASVNSQIVVQFDGQTSTQNMSLNMGATSNSSGITQFGTQSSLLVDNQDGFADGVLSNLSVDASGNVIGFYSNSQERSLGDVGISSFANQEGLMAVGSNLYQETAASGNPRLGMGGTGGRAAVVSGALEESNVDTAEQTVRLIEAQRGFQANARVISVQDEMLREVANLL
ncbi:MAG: flagellar hook protein FlgE, partial [Planctomycetota bacterium]